MPLSLYPDTRTQISEWVCENVNFLSLRKIRFLDLRAAPFKGNRASGRNRGHGKGLPAVSPSLRPVTAAQTWIAIYVIQAILGVTWQR